MVLNFIFYCVTLNAHSLLNNHIPVISSARVAVACEQAHLIGYREPAKRRKVWVKRPILLASFRLRLPPGGRNPIWNRRECSSGILKLTPKGDHLGVAQAFCDP